MGIIAVTYTLSNFIMKHIQHHQVCKHHGLSRQEYKHIAEQLKKAEQQILEFNKYFLRVRSVHQFKLILEMHRLSRNIIKIVKKEPKKFYNVEPFFYAHLETATQLTKQYTMLTQQPLKDREIQLALSETRTTLTDLHDTIEYDLKRALADDIEQLKIEIEFAKHSNKQQQERIEWLGDNNDD